MVEVSVKINAGDLYDYMLMHTYNSLAGLLGSVVGALLVVYALSTRQWLFLILGVIMLVYLPWTLFIKSRRQILSNPTFSPWSLKWFTITLIVLQIDTIATKIMSAS